MKCTSQPMAQQTSKQLIIAYSSSTANATYAGLRQLTPRRADKHVQKAPKQIRSCQGGEPNLQHMYKEGDNHRHVEDHYSFPGGNKP